MAANPADTATRATSLAELRTSATPREANLPAVRAGFTDLASYELAGRIAKALAASTLVPKTFQGNMPDCIIALELSQRIGASPLMVMQNLAIIHGKPSWSSKFLIAAVNQCGRFTELQYEWSGERGKDSWGCRAWAKSKATGDRVQGPEVTIKMAKDEGWYDKSGSKWKTIPELMLMYRAGGWFANTNAPELTMGLSTQEEMHDVIDVQQVEPGRFETTTEEIKPAQPATDPAPATPGAANPDGPPGAPPVEITLEVVLDYISKANSEDAADIALDMGQGKLDKKQWAEAVTARNARVKAIKGE